MNKDFLLIILKRFAKAFVLGGFASLVAQMAMVPQISDLESFKPWLLSLVIAFLTGGLMAIEKSLQGYNPQ